MCSDNRSVFNSIHKPFGVGAKILAKNFNLRFVPIQPQISYILSKLTVPMSNLSTPPVETYLPLFPKQSRVQVFRLRQDCIVIQLLWLPSRVGIRGNEIADAAACRVAKTPPTYFPTYFKELYPLGLDE